MSTCLGCGRPWAGRELHCDVCRGEAEPEDSPAPPSRRGLTPDKQVGKALALSEAEIRLAIRRWCESRGAIAVIDAEQGYRPDRCPHCGERTGKGTTRIVRGFPDLVVLWPPPRRVWWIECKRFDGRQTEHQRRFQAWCEAAGQVYLIARSVDDVAALERRERAA